MTSDSRGWRIALVPSALVNQPTQPIPKLPDALTVLESHGYGLLQLPPPGEHRLLLAVIADQVAEYAHHGYAVVAIGIAGEPHNGLHWQRLAPLLRHRKVKLPPRHLIRPNEPAALETQQLSAFLETYDLPAAEQQLWRV